MTGNFLALFALLCACLIFSLANLRVSASSSQGDDALTNLVKSELQKMMTSQSSDVATNVRETVKQALSREVNQAVSTSMLPNGDKAGVRFLLGVSGINKIIEDALPEIIANLKATPFPDQTIVTSVALAGEITVNLTNIRIESLEINSVAAAFKQPNILIADANGLSIVIALDFSFQQKSWPHSAGTGDVLATCTDASLNLIVATEVRADQPDKPFLNAKNATISLGTMKVKITGGGSVGWLLNLLESLFKNQIRKSIEKTMSESILTTINVQVNTLIANTPFVFEIPFPPEVDIQGQVDVGLTSAPLVNAENALVLDTKALFSVPGRPAVAPFLPADLPTTMSSQNNDFSLYLTQWVPNNALWQLFNDGKLKYRLTDDILPPSSPIHLNTKDLKNYIPELYEKFPDQKVVIDLEANAAPSVQFTTPISTSLNASLTFSVVDASGSIVPAFKMTTYLAGSVSKFSVTASADGSAIVITGSLNTMTITANLEQTWMGPVNVDRIRMTVSILINNGVLPAINELLEAGQLIQLPQGLKISNIVFEFVNGYLSIGGQVKYAPECGTSLYWFKRRAFMTKSEKLVFGKFGCIAGYYERELCRDLICKMRL